MLIDTHCHINILIKKNFDVPLLCEEINAASAVIEQARAHDVSHIINVGTNFVESKNCVALAQKYNNCFAAVGIHPNDCTAEWRTELKEIEQLLKNAEKNKIVAIGECGLDRHYPDYNIARQKDAFKAQIELALTHDLALIVHTRDAHDETLRSLEEFAGQITRGVIHCFSEDQSFADQVIAWNFFLGIGGIITYPKNNDLRAIVKQVTVKNIVLETDAPFLPPQHMRGKTNHPLHIKTVAEYIAQLSDISLESVAQETSNNTQRLFRILI
ncbi:MAG TPA: TatD family hydrolase [Candidatus Babeliales bacterium]|nr:TatD family hydrolase [Candidatus Babeliales bacterium]